jgi:hypothetical protein
MQKGYKMADLPISDEMMEELRRVAEQEGQSTEEIAEAIVKQYVLSRRFPIRGGAAAEDADTRDVFMRIARAADALGVRSERTNISELSREILSLEFPEYLKRRQSGQADE